MRWYGFLSALGSGLIIAMVWLVGKHLLQVAGGSLSLIVLFPGLVMGGLLYDMKREAGYLSALLLLLIALNATHFLISQKTLPVDSVAVLYNAVVLATVYVIASAISGALRPVEDLSDTQNALILRQNFLWKVYWYPLVGFMYSLFVSLLLPERYERQVFLNMTPICFIAVPVFLMVTLLWIRGWGWHKLDFIMNEGGLARAPNPTIPGKVYLVLAAVVGVLGTILEILTRNEMALWFESFFTTNITVLLVWKVQMHRAGATECQDVPAEKPLLTAKHVSATVIFYWVGAMVLGFLALGYIG